MRQVSKILFFLALVALAKGYFEDDEHRTKVAGILNDFVVKFSSKYDTLVFGEMEWHQKMELAFGYWITSIRFTGLNTASVYIISPT